MCLTPAWLSQAYFLIGQASGAWVQGHSEARNNCGVCSGAPLPRWPDPVPPVPVGGGGLWPRVKSGCGACLASGLAAGLQARPSSSPPHPQGCLWTSTSTMSCTCQRSFSRPSSGSFLSPCSPLTSTPTLWASSVSAPLPLLQLLQGGVAAGLRAGRFGLSFKESLVGSSP